MKSLLVITLFASSFALASGWNCNEENDGYPRAKVVNHTTNPRVPAVFIVSDESGTLVSAKNEDISKRNLSNGVRYSAYGEDNTQAVLFVKYLEGSSAPLKNGETVEGKLVVTVEGEKATYNMICARYLKNN